jgi:hypothetical protein
MPLTVEDRFDDSHFLAAIACCVFKRKFGNALAARSGIDPGADRDSVRVIVNWDVVLKADVEAFGIRSHQHKINGLVASSPNQGSGGPHDSGDESENFVWAELEAARQRKRTGPPAILEYIVAGGQAGGRSNSPGH